MATDMDLDVFDLRETTYLSPVRDQLCGNCCYSFCACLVVEHLFREETGYQVVLSPQDSYETLIHSNREDQKGLSAEAPFAWMTYGGCLLEETRPYRGTWWGRTMQHRVPLFFLNGYDRIPLEAMRNYLRSTGPIVVGLRWIEEMGAIRDEIYRGPADPMLWEVRHDGTPLGHTVVVIGYGWECINGEDVNYWLVQNSHGVGWGNNGYGRISANITLPSGSLLINGGVVPRKGIRWLRTLPRCPMSIYERTVEGESRKRSRFTSQKKDVEKADERTEGDSRKRQKFTEQRKHVEKADEAPRPGGMNSLLGAGHSCSMISIEDLGEGGGGAVLKSKDEFEVGRDAKYIFSADFASKNQKMNLRTIIIIASSSSVTLKWRKTRGPSSAVGPAFTSSLNKRSGLGSMLSSSITSSTSMSTMPTSILSVKTFSLSELEKATDKFNSKRVLGKGGFGRGYSGTLEDGAEVAVKLLTRDNNQNGDREFIAEVEMLSCLHHRNLVKLIGICIEGRKRCLVYELVPNGSVESHLHGNIFSLALEPTSLYDKNRGPLDWEARMKIALGAVRGLVYLHEDSNPRVIHRDFKASNVLLEDDFTRKVSEFGLAREATEGSNHISTWVMGTFGFMEDHNTATFPSKKYYSLDAYYRRQIEKEMKKGFKQVKAKERTVFNDEEQRRQELLQAREKHKEEQVIALKREMESGMAQAMKEQAQLREEMAYQYKVGNFEAAAAIQRWLDPDPDDHVIMTNLISPI